MCFNRFFIILNYSIISLQQLAYVLMTYIVPKRSSGQRKWSILKVHYLHKKEVLSAVKSSETLKNTPYKLNYTYDTYKLGITWHAGESKISTLITSMVQFIVKFTHAIKSI